MNISGNTIFIAGGTSGIGLALAVALQNEGNKVIIGGRRSTLLQEISSKHPKISTVVIDVDDPKSIRTAYESVTEDFPDLNVLVTMSGIMYPEDLKNPDFLDVAERTITTNLLGTIRLVGQFIPHLLTKPTATIATVSSAVASSHFPSRPRTTPRKLPFISSPRACAFNSPILRSSASNSSHRASAPH